MYGKFTVLRLMPSFRALPRWSIQPSQELPFMAKLRQPESSGAVAIARQFLDAVSSRPCSQQGRHHGNFDRCQIWQTAAIMTESRHFTPGRRRCLMTCTRLVAVRLYEPCEKADPSREHRHARDPPLSRCHANSQRDDRLTGRAPAFHGLWFCDVTG